jgi:hypothetical protein
MKISCKIEEIERDEISLKTAQIQLEIEEKNRKSKHEINYIKIRSQKDQVHGMMSSSAAKI